MKWSWIRRRKQGVPPGKEMVVYTPPLTRGELIRKWLTTSRGLAIYSPTTEPAVIGSSGEQTHKKVEKGLSWAWLLALMVMALAFAGGLSWLIVNQSGTVDGTTPVSGSSKWWTIGALVIILPLIGRTIYRKLYKGRRSGAANQGSTGLIAAWKKDALESFGHFGKKYREQLVKAAIYTVLTYGLWFVAMALTSHFHTNYFDWLWNDWWIFLGIPTVFLLAVLSVSFGHRGTHALTIFMVLILATGTWYSYKKTPMYQAHVARWEAEKAKDAQEKLVQNTSSTRKVELRTGPYGWSPPVLFEMGDHYEYTISDYCELSVLVDGERKIVVPAGSPKLPNLGLSPGNHNVQFMTGQVATTTIKFTPNY